MTTVMFVHGTGVRQPRYDAIFARLERGLAHIQPAVPVERCYWGEVGARLGRGGASIPDGDSTRGLSGADVEGVDPWVLLELDPLFELRLYAGENHESAELAPGAAPAARSVVAAAAKLSSHDEVRAALVAAGLQSAFADAVTAVLASEPARLALARCGPSEAGLRTALARAFVATALNEADRSGGGLLSIDGDDRDAVVVAVVGQLGGEARGIVGKLAWAGARLALELGATRKVERARAAITQAASPVAGDILMYLARGAVLRDFVADALAAVDDDVILVAHSLGGVVCVDLLVERTFPNVSALVTVGSQVPYLYEVDALPSLPFPKLLPGRFPGRWVNVFDRRDLLSFAATPIFGAQVTDCEVDSRAPFPRSHSAYFANPSFYAVLTSVIAQVRG